MSQCINYRSAFPASLCCLRKHMPSKYTECWTMITGLRSTVFSISSIVCYWCHNTYRDPCARIYDSMKEWVAPMARVTRGLASVLNFNVIPHHPTSPFNLPPNLCGLHIGPTSPVRNVRGSRYHSYLAITVWGTPGYSYLYHSYPVFD